MNPPQNASQAWQRLLQHVRNHWSPDRWRDVGVVVGCSGGADSVALLVALAQLRIKHHDQPRGFLIAAHFNHGLRGEESDADQAFVETLAGQLEIPCIAERGAGLSKDESSLRNSRLQFLIDAAKRTGARYIALAHSADDNVETLLHHLLRGTGPAGLAGIGSPRPVDQDLVLIRPLLQTARATIREALESSGQTWREDSSNANIDYRRNWIRHRLIPLIQSEYPDAVNAIGRTITSQRQWRTLVDDLASQWIDHHRLAWTPVTLRRDNTADASVIIAAAQRMWTEKNWSRGDMGQEHWTRLVKTIQSEQRERYTLPGRIDVNASGSRVIVQPAD